MGRWRALGCLVVVLVALVGAGAPVSAGAVPSAAPAAAQSFERITFEIAVHEDGSARWSFRYERTLPNASAREQFEAFAERFTETRTALYADFVNQSKVLADHGERETGRNMTATDFARRAFVSRQLNDIGVVEMAFTWTGFAVRNGSRLIIGDVFEGGLYLGHDQTLVVAAGDGVRFDSVDPPGTPSGPSLEGSDTVTWQGERTFTDNRPRVVFTIPSATDGGAGTPSTTTAPGTTAGDGDASTTDAVIGGEGENEGSVAGGVVSVLVIGLVALLVVGLGAIVVRRRAGTAAVSTGAPDRPASAGSSGMQTAAERPALVDDHQRVSELIAERGGRMRQSAIVEETGWSKSKVSMVLSDMEAEGRVTKIRIGRENLVSLPGQEPDAAGSPYDE